MFQNLLRDTAIWIGGLVLLGLSNCTVYAPMQPATPMLRDRGQAEVGMTTFMNNRLEAAAAYSPLRYVTVRAAGGLQTDNRDTTYFRNRQFEVGAGGYWPITERLLVSGLGGYGQARGVRGFMQSQGLFSGLPSELTEYRSRYHKVYGEAFAAYEFDYVTLGMAYRLTKVKFDALTNNGTPIRLREMTRSEPLVFVRVGAREGKFSWLHLQAGVGASVVPGFDESTNTNREENDRRQIKEGKNFITLGLVFYPHRLRRQPVE